MVNENLKLKYKILHISHFCKRQNWSPRPTISAHFIWPHPTAQHGRPHNLWNSISAHRFIYLFILLVFQCVYIYIFPSTEIRKLCCEYFRRRPFVEQVKLKLFFTSIQHFCRSGLCLEFSVARSELFVCRFQNFQLVTDRCREGRFY